MSGDQDQKKGDDKGHRTQIIVALIGLVGVIATAALGNLDNIRLFLSELFETSENTTGQDQLPAPRPNDDRCDVTVRTPRADSFFLVGWDPVAGAATYTVEYDCFGCRDSGGQWHSINAQAPWHLRTGLGLRTPIYSSKIHNELEEQGGLALRWRVWAVDHDGVKSTMSQWCKVTFFGLPEG